MKNIAVFYHCLFYKDNPLTLLDAAIDIIGSQLNEMDRCGLTSVASEFIVGINGGGESVNLAKLMFPAKARCHFHGLQCKNENRTILELEKWIPSHKDWHVLYFHSKGATRPYGDSFSDKWRKCMMKHNVSNWRRCVSDLESGHDMVGCHWMEPPDTPEGHYIFAGTFWWATSNYLATLPSIMCRDRIKVSGIDSIDSRYEAEVWSGNGPIKPKIKDYHGPKWNPSKFETCNNS